MSVLGLSTSHAALSFIKTAALAAQKQAAARATQKSPDDPLIAVLAKSDPAKAQAWRDEQAQTKQLLNQLAASKTEASAQRKEAARQKIQQLKAQMQALRMMANGDPKTVARQAARLARELASASREYANSGGTGDAGAASSVTASTSAPVETAEGAEAETPTPVVGAPVMTASFNQDDAAFAGEARGLMNNLKNILKHARHKMAREDGDYHTRDTQEAEIALRDTEKSLNGIMAGALNVSVSVNIAV